MIRSTEFAICCMVAISTTLILAPPAKASATGSAAQALFDDAKALMASGQYAEACPKLQESQRLDPGGGTILLLARCHAKEGATASAWTDYQEALRIAIRDNRADRQQIARAEGKAIEGRLSKLIVAVNPANAPTGLVVRRDGEEVGRSQWSLAVAVNPGTHEIVATAPDRAPWQITAQVRGDGVVVKVEVPELARVPATHLLKSEAPFASAAAAPPGSAPISDDRSRPANAQRIVGMATAAAGVALLGGSAYFVLKAKSTNDRSNEPGNCAGDACSPGGFDVRHQGVIQARTATILFGVGAAAAVGGAVLWLTAPSDSVQVRLSLGPQAIAVEGVW